MLGPEVQKSQTGGAASPEEHPGFAGQGGGPQAPGSPLRSPALLLPWTVRMGCPGRGAGAPGSPPRTGLQVGKGFWGLPAALHSALKRGDPFILFLRQGPSLPRPGNHVPPRGGRPQARGSREPADRAGSPGSLQGLLGQLAPPPTPRWGQRWPCGALDLQAPRCSRDESSSGGRTVSRSDTSAGCQLGALPATGPSLGRGGPAVWPRTGAPAAAPLTGDHAGSAGPAGRLQGPLAPRLQPVLWGCGA